MKVFTNTALGETWKIGRKKWTSIDIKKRQSTTAVKYQERVTVLTAGVDVQDDRLEVEIVGWGVEEARKLGNILQGYNGKVLWNNTWNELDNILNKEYTYANGEK